jgi:hypothetical protein
VKGAKKKLTQKKLDSVLVKSDSSARISGITKKVDKTEKSKK